MYDVIIIGAGIGGLCSAARLAKMGKKVLLLEKGPHIGGTSHIFRRGGYSFPMGPLSFSFYRKVKDFMEETGINSDHIAFTRNHFQLVTPEFDIIYSLDFATIKEELKRIFRNQSGIDPFFDEIERVIALTQDIDLWHPDYQVGEKRWQALERVDNALKKKIDLIRNYSRTPCERIIDRSVSNQSLKNLLGSQGTYRPEMSVLTLAFMWNVMCSEGIWSPSCGINGLNDLIKDAFLKYGGQILLRSPVKEILIEGTRATGVKAASGEVFEAHWVVSNADYKRTFLELIDNRKIPMQFLERVKQVPYTGSELCVYLGIDPQKVDLSPMRAHHLFYRHRIDPGEVQDLEGFDNREIEICLWSESAPGLVPPSMASLVLRVQFPYDLFARFRTGERMRTEDYKGYKQRLANSLIDTAERLLPGLKSAITIMEAATPLTYEDWGQRYRGSIAGWTWGAGYENALGGKILVQTPIENLLMVGIYASSELFLGGVPTALRTAELASDFIMEKL